MSLPAYIAEHSASLQPPVCNRMIHNDGMLRVMVVGGPNQRKDYHLNLGEELFYQIKGAMCVKVMECGEPKDVVINEGEFFCLPARIPHSPQRFENTVGLVIERARKDDELDGLRYFVDETNQEILWQRFFHVTNLGKQLVPLIQEFFASEEFTTRKPSPDMPPSAWETDTTTLLAPPFPLASRFGELHTGRPPLQLCNKEFVAVLVGGETRTPALPIATECFVWVVAADGAAEAGGGDAGSAPAATANGHALSGVGDTVLLAEGLNDLAVSPQARVLIVYTLAF